MFIVHVEERGLAWDMDIWYIYIYTCTCIVTAGGARDGVGHGYSSRSSYKWGSGSCHPNGLATVERPWISASASSRWALVCCRMLQCVAVRGSVLQCVAVNYSVSDLEFQRQRQVDELWCVAVCCSVWQFAVVCCSVLQWITAWATLNFSVSDKSISSGVLQCVAVCCSVLRCAAAWANLNISISVKSKSSGVCDDIYVRHTAAQCNTVQHAATHCNTLQHAATHCNTLQHIAT